MLVVMIIALCGFGFYLFKSYAISTNSCSIDESIEHELGLEIQQLFDSRNNALLEKNTNILTSLYNKEVRNGLWAYEHEIKKMNYLHQWAEKQSIRFTKIHSNVFVRNIKKKNNGYTLNLSVSTEYEYVYSDSTIHNNSFSLGTYHSLDLISINDRWVITKEWYTDPFADSLNANKMNIQKMNEIILSNEAKDISNLNPRRLGALNYIDKYCGVAIPPEYEFKYNSKYGNFNPQGGDCANFASQMLYEGAGFTKNRTWNYERGAGSKAWLNAHAFNNYMLYSGRASLIAKGSYEQVLKNSYKLLPGDYIAYEKKGKVTHISVVSGIDSKGYVLVNSHNSDRYRVPWDLGWSNSNIKFWLVHVNY